MAASDEAILWDKFLGSRTFAPEENCPQPLTLTGGQFSSGTIVWLPPNPKTSPNFDSNPNPNRGAIFIGGQLSGYQISQSG